MKAGVTECSGSHTPRPRTERSGRHALSLGSVALIGALAAGTAEAQGAPDGFVALSDDMGVASYRVLGDGSLELTLQDGSIRVLAPGEFTMLEGGGVAIAGDVAAELAALAEGLSGAAVIGGAAAGLIVVAGSSGGGQAAQEPMEPPAPPPPPPPPPPVLPTTPIELSEIAQSNDPRGFVINGVSQYDQAGYSVSLAGDVNGDGFDDLIVGAVWSYANGFRSGASYVVFGKTDGTAVELSDVASGNGGFAIRGVSAFDYSGEAVSGAGDVNGDGLDDLIVGARLDDPNEIGNAGASFVVFGKTDGTVVELSDVEAGNGGFVINGVSGNDYSGRSVSSAGDVNGDGFDDLIVGALFDDPNGAGSGASFVVFGKPDGATVDLSDVEAGKGGFVINGVTNGDNSGHSVHSAGDVNGDGLADLIIGAPRADPNGNASGTSYVVFGKTDGTAVELSAVAAGTGGFAMNGITNADQAGFSVSSAGDVNGDGLDDLIIGAPYADKSGDRSGTTYVVFGKSNGLAIELSEIALGNGGFAIHGASVSDRSGRSVSSAGDVNGDGFDDLIIGAYQSDPNGSNSGASYVVFGKTDGTTISLSDVATGNGGFVINGAASPDYSGVSVSSAGDVNGDGFDDLIIGAHLADPNGANSGASYVVFGGNFTGALTQLGTAGIDNLAGTTANDVIFAGIGNDILDGGGGTDRLSGGAGSDTFTLRNLNGTTTIIDFDGGEGDTLDVSAFGLASFAAFQALLSPEGPGGHDTRITLDPDTIVILQDIKFDELVVSNVTL